MKPTFRETADKKLRRLEFTDDMKLAVLAGCRRVPAYRRWTPIIAAACTLIFLIFGGALVFIVSPPAPDNVAAPGYPIGKHFSSESFDLIIDSYDWQGYWLTIGCTVVSRADESVIITRSPFEAADNRLIEASQASLLRPYAENALLIEAGQSAHFSVRLRMNGCAPGQTFAIDMRADFMEPVDIYDAAEVQLISETPMLVYAADSTIEIITGAYELQSGEVSYYDWPTIVWEQTMNRNYALLPRQLVSDGLVYEQYETIRASLNVTVPSSSRTGTIISSSVSGNGLFYVSIENAAFSPAASLLEATITPSAPLLRKESYIFKIRFTGAGGSLIKEVTAAAYTTGTDRSGNISISFDKALDFAPETVTFICEWTDGDASGVAEAAFDHSPF